MVLGVFHSLVVCITLSQGDFSFCWTGVGLFQKLKYPLGGSVGSPPTKLLERRSSGVGVLLGGLKDLPFPLGGVVVRFLGCSPHKRGESSVARFVLRLRNVLIQSVYQSFYYSFVELFV